MKYCTHLPSTILYLKAILWGEGGLSIFNATPINKVMVAISALGHSNVSNGGDIKFFLSHLLGFPLRFPYIF